MVFVMFHIQDGYVAQCNAPGGQNIGTEDTGLPTVSH